MANKNGVTYIWSHNDDDVSLYRDMLQFDVCSSLKIEGVASIQHGSAYNPLYQEQKINGFFSPRFHNLSERLLETWIRYPIENFYTIENRLLCWFFHKYVLFSKLKNKIFKLLGLSKWTGKSTKKIQYWVDNQQGNACALFPSIPNAINDVSEPHLMTGHSPLPGIISLGDKKYINPGSWLFDATQYATWNGKEFSVHDWRKGTVITDEAYTSLPTSEE